MTTRPRLTDEGESGGGSYFASPKTHHEFIPSGCKLLDCVIGGGWALGRISNIIGDKSTGKSLLAIESCANFMRKFPKGKTYYRETESAFDPEYGSALGMPVDDIDFGQGQIFETVEDVIEDLELVLEQLRNGEPALYIIDSLDALSDRGEMERDIDKGSYGAEKAKKMSQLFRRLVRKIENSNCHLMIISQVRDAIGVTFGRKTTRSGGRALDFYASQVIYLAHVKTETRTIKGVERPVGVRIKVKCDKNKISLPYRSCEFSIAFGFGIANLHANLDWLKEVKRIGDIGLATDKEVDAFKKEVDKMPDNEYFAKVAYVDEVVSKVWFEIEESFMPTRKKY